jgi:hypothetical protein
MDSATGVFVEPQYLVYFGLSRKMQILIDKAICALNSAFVAR